MSRHPLTFALGIVVLGASVAAIAGGQAGQAGQHTAGLSCGRRSIGTNHPLYAADAVGAATPDQAIAGYLAAQRYDLRGRLDPMAAGSGEAVWRVTENGRTTVLARATDTGTGWLVREIAGCEDVLVPAKEVTR